ncbi:M14-type cytosolic carboxypeptidase [Psychromonas sp.]|uniref:M14 family metallopeptidase n=1 Tax=Psychromonas sp. TaxID=1884585 RepID=UPI0035656CDB
MFINSNFDGGNIRCLTCENPADIQLQINKDHNSDFYQWFYFRLSGAQGKNCSLKIINAADASYVEGWQGYQAVASYDKVFWFRVDSSYRDGIFQIDHKPEFQSVYYAYFAPYSMERYGDFIGNVILDPKVQLDTLGKTLDGQDLDQLIISNPAISGRPDADKKKIWINARQHPGETMASWWIEGFVKRLLDENDSISRALLEQAIFYVVPNMNPDGSRRGHLRTNALGVNLNREWLTPTLEKSPEVYFVRQKMHKIGVDFCLDVHGDEALPYNFIAGAQGIPSWNEQLAALQDRFAKTLMQVNPDFQMEKGYPVSKPGQANMTVCTNYIAETFNCLALTLEMPFKDTIETPNPAQGWSPERSAKLGASCLDAVCQIVADLR